MHEEREHVHLGELLRGFEGKWVAIKDGEVVMAADTPYALVGKLRERRIEDAAVIRAPGVDEPEMVGFG
jgi:hypothetical protein